VELNSKSDWAFFRLGQAYAELGEIDRANEAFDEVLRLDASWQKRIDNIRSQPQ
jgi:predicted Zn-dependent protease